MICIDLLDILFRGKSTFAIFFLIFASMLLLLAYFNNGYVMAAAAKQQVDDKNCRSGDVLNGVEKKERFTILSRCEVAEGKVHDVTKVSDGDYKFHLELKSKYKYLLNDGNLKKTNGMLIIEVIPKDQGSKSLELPNNNDQIVLWGAWVTDNPKGWNEFHPAWKVVVLSHGESNKNRIKIPFEQEVVYKNKNYPDGINAIHINTITTNNHHDHHLGVDYKVKQSIHKVKHSNFDNKIKKFVQKHNDDQHNHPK